MNGTTNTKPFAGFAPGEHRQLLADVNRWRRINGWNWGDTRGLVNGRFTSEATIAIDWAPADDKPQGFSIAVRDSVGRRWSSPDFYPAASLRQAVDLLVVLGVLPLAFSSQWQRGVKDGRWIEAGWDTPADEGDDPIDPLGSGWTQGDDFHEVTR